MVKGDSELSGEVKLNLLSVAASLLIFLSAAGIGLAIDSITLLLSSSAQLVDVITGFFYHRVITTVDREPNERYHFGFAKYEPLTAFLSGVLILSACVFSLKFAVQDIIHPEEVENYSAGLVLAGVTAVVSFMLVPLLRKYARVFHSSILRVIAVEWFNDGLSSVGIAVGFLLAQQFSREGHSLWAAYVDPVMSIILVGFLVVEPIKIVRSSLEDLLDINPGETTEEQAKELAENLRKEFNLAGVKKVRLRKAGRKIFLEIKFVTPPESSVRELEKLTAHLTALAREIFHPIDVTVTFTTGET
ncbi:MAG TPA: cation diffusion facilitator family transporter [bacterium]|nr:cation diffusion facilitator family transporter [bacterium]HPP11287.1 cation diffusion facilitator family transporter [bacterium]